MKKNGFTLVELLVTIVIIALLGGIGIISYQTFFNTGERKYYSSLESNILLAGNDYFLDHRESLPQEHQVSEVLLANLIDTKYLEPVKDSKGNLCTEGKVYAYKENNKYNYSVCLECGDGYKSSGKFCDGSSANIINVNAVKKDSGTSYDATKSYSEAEYINNEDLSVTFSMSNIDINISKYEVINDRTKVMIPCPMTGNTCTANITLSGTYQVKAYDEDNKEIASRYINVKIARNGPKYTITGENKYQIDKASCNNNQTTKQVAFTIVKDNINEEYQNIRYRINRKLFNGTYSNGTYHEISNLSISEELESGSYELEVVVTNFAGESITKRHLFDVSYIVDIEFDDNNYAGLSKTHEVVKGQSYSYLKQLPAKKDAYELTNVDIRWHRNNVPMTVTDEVVNSCTHTIVGKMSILVDIPPKLTDYCKNVTYTGSEQTITKTAPTNVTFTNNKQTNAGTYTVKAHVNSPQYVWSDETTADKSFNCTLNQKSIGSCPASPANKTYNGANQNSGVTCPTGGTASGDTSKKDVGTYTQTCTGSGNYTGTCSTTWEIVAKSIGSCPASPADKVYTGNNQNSGVTCPEGSAASGNTNGTNVGTYTQTCTGSGNYTGTCSTTWKIVQAANPISVTSSQSWTTEYSTNAQTNAITAATGAVGTVTYEINSQPSGNYFSLSGTTVTMKKETPAGSYNVVIRATASGNANYKSGYKDITLSVNVRYIVYFNANGGSGTTNAVYCTRDSNCTLPANGFSKSNANFMFWSTTSGTTILMSDSTERSATIASGNSSKAIYRFANIFKATSGSQYGVEVDIKGTGSRITNYLYGTNNDAYINLISTTNSAGETLTGLKDGRNYAPSSSGPLPNSYTHYSVKYIANTGSNQENKHLYFLVEGAAGKTGYIKNVILYKRVGTEGIYMNQSSVRNLTTSTITLYAIWEGTGSGSSGSSTCGACHGTPNTTCTRNGVTVTYNSSGIACVNNDCCQ